MRKIILSIILTVSTLSALNAQVEGKAIGLRFGGVDGTGAEISYQHPLNNSHRLEFALGTTSYGSAVSCVYQKVWDLSTLSDGFNWYVGGGGVVGLSSSTVGVGILGQIGIEYKFNIPLQLSLDYRPSILTANKSDIGSACFSVRYRF